MHLVDTHQHLWDLERFPYSWTEGIPALHRSFLVDDYHAAAADSGITKSVFVECDVDPPHLLDEARWVSGLATANPSIAGMVASCRPDEDGFEAHLEALGELPLVRGLRRVLHTQPDELSRRSKFREHLERLPAHDYTFDLCVLSRQLPVAIELVRGCPGVRFILDHCGVPDVKGGGLDPWRDQIRTLADCDNLVACKLSGLVAYADPDGWTVDDLRPWFEHAIDCFGWDRVVWGGDWPVCTLSASLSEWVDATRSMVAGASDDERARLFHRNAERIYRV